MLQSLKTEVVDRLVSDPYFSDPPPGIPVLDDRMKELDVEIDKALANVNGLCVFVTIPISSTSTRFSNLKGPYIDSCTLFFRVFENPILNAQNNQDGTGKTALETAQTIAAILHLFMPLGAMEPVLFERIALADDPDRVAWDVVMSNRGGIKYDVPAVDQPVVTANAGVGEITCALPGAAIFYTLNGGVPVPRGNGSMLYTGPFVVGTGVTIRTRAWLAGYLGSKETSLKTP